MKCNNSIRKHLFENIVLSGPTMPKGFQKRLENKIVTHSKSNVNFIAGYHT